MVLRWFGFVFLVALVWEQLPGERARGHECVTARPVAAPRPVTVNRALIEAIAADPWMLTQGARPVPFIEDGERTGFKLFAVQGDSLLASLGLASGDVVLQANGHALGQVDDARALAPSDGAETATLDILRHDQPLRLEYQIRD